MVRSLDGPPAMCSQWHLMWNAMWNIDDSGWKILLGSLSVLDGFVSMLSIARIRVDHIIVVSGLKELSEEKYSYMFELVHSLLRHDNTHKWENGRTTFHWINDGSQECLSELASSISHCIDIKWDFYPLLMRLPRDDDWSNIHLWIESPWDCIQPFINESP